MSREQEINYLKNQAQAARDELKEVEARIEELKGE